MYKHFFQVCKKAAYYKDTKLLMGDELQDLLRQIMFSLKTETNSLDDIKKLKDILLVVTQLLINIKEQLDTIKHLRSMEKFFLKRFQGSDDDIRFWAGFYSYDALMSFYSTLLEPEAVSRPT